MLAALQGIQLDPEVEPVELSPVQEAAAQAAVEATLKRKREEATNGR